MSPLVRRSALQSALNLRYSSSSIRTDICMVGLLVPDFDRLCSSSQRSSSTSWSQWVSEATGDLPQNVNFAIRGEIAKLFLSQNGVDPSLSLSDAKLDPVTIAERASEYTTFITCD
ncbi:hypothetical protein [Tateyamaria pelophila]|uniref:hypothetical protein n=1 Tax=Tateyamaria pelophila TaxID=328415 RepID=UPI001CBDC0A1|nr:hypothetical protein [Tateyamaria pelophila]